MSRLHNIKIKDVRDYGDILKVVVTADYFGDCVFLFHGNFITCFGDIKPFTWNCTWNAKTAIMAGNCNARNYGYFTEKLEWRSELSRLDGNALDSELKEIKQEYADQLEGEEKEEFLEKWEDNEVLLGMVETNRLTNLDDFLENVGIEDVEYSRFFSLPSHYECAVEFLIAIEDYFKEKANG